MRQVSFTLLVALYAVDMAYLCSTRGTTGTNQWHNTCPSGHWYEATFAGLCLNASKVVAVPEQQFIIKAHIHIVLVIMDGYISILAIFLYSTNPFLSYCPMCPYVSYGISSNDYTYENIDIVYGQSWIMLCLSLNPSQTTRIQAECRKL